MARVRRVDVIIPSALAEVPIDLFDLFIRHMILVDVRLLQCISSPSSHNSCETDLQGSTWPKAGRKEQQGDKYLSYSFK